MAKRKRRGGLRGLAGTPAEHRQRAEEFLRIAEKEMSKGLCLDALQTASFAVAEADWLPVNRDRIGYRQMMPGDMKHRADALRRRALACVKRG